MPRFNKPTGTITCLAGANIDRYRILKFGSDDETVIKAAAASDSLIGVSGQGDGTDPSMIQTTGDQVDVHTSGSALLEFGGTITRGGLVTSDSIGRGVAASSGNRVIGIALVSGVVGDIGSVLISPGVF